MHKAIPKVFIVDDNPTARMIASCSLSDLCYPIVELDSGTALLGAIEQEQGIILLDVEMPGLDGIETCQALRDAENDSHIIFISAHDDLETRMRAYDAGGHDYLVKPFVSEELLKKVQVAHQLLDQRHGLTQQSKSAQQAAFTAMTSMNELGVVLGFLRASYGCQTLEQLAKELLDTLEQFGLHGLLELRNQATQFTVCSRSPCTPLELSALGHAKGMGKIFQFSNRIVINYPGITLIVPNLPKQDPDRTGRLRDHLAILAEGADARITAMINDEARLTQSTRAIQAVQKMTASLTTIDAQLTEHRLRGLVFIDESIAELERSFQHLELSHAQEDALNRMMQRNAQKMGGLLGESKIVCDRFHEITASLQQITMQD